LDNDQVIEDLKRHLAQEFGARSSDRYWTLFEALRTELGYADYLGALQRYRMNHIDDPELLLMSGFLLEYPFAQRLYANAMDALSHVRR
jgi:hypothetical protein